MNISRVNIILMYKLGYLYGLDRRFADLDLRYLATQNASRSGKASTSSLAIKTSKFLCCFWLKNYAGRGSPKMTTAL